MVSAGAALSAAAHLFSLYTALYAVARHDMRAHSCGHFDRPFFVYCLRAHRYDLPPKSIDDEPDSNSHRSYLSSRLLGTSTFDLWADLDHFHLPLAVAHACLAFSRCLLDGARSACRWTHHAPGIYVADLLYQWALTNLRHCSLARKKTASGAGLCLESAAPFRSVYECPQRYDSVVPAAALALAPGRKASDCTHVCRGNADIGGGNLPQGECGSAHSRGAAFHVESTTRRAAFPSHVSRCGQRDLCGRDYRLLRAVLAGWSDSRCCEGQSRDPSQYQYPGRFPEPFL